MRVWCRQPGHAEDIYTCKKQVPRVAITVMVLIGLIGVTLLAQQDRYTLEVPDGLAFSEFRGYDTWETVAVPGNPTMIRACKEGVPGTGKPFPEGSQAVKIEWIKNRNPVSPYFVEMPDVLKSVSFIEKDSKRFPKTQGWAFAQIAHDSGSKTFKPSVTGSEMRIHVYTRVASRDYISTEYPPR